ncbi:YbgC/FadM family acyl-CoA thioesterase [Hydrogenophaga defluvii]|uniref:YbgC/FadM family acyl-CoA thioesterase n=1 Tax=Hydrogenophaga defluvii TaxID=249410 RepID=A0ABW2S9H9_9BURK
MKRSDFRFFHRLRVRWAEVDMQKIVFNAHYLMYFDTAITEYWRALALPMEEVFARLGGELYVKKATVEFNASAQMDDLIDVALRCERIGNSSIQFIGAIFHGDKHLISSEIIYVFADPISQTSRPVPEALRNAFMALEAGEPMVEMKVGTWAELGQDAGQVRNEVFVEEQKIPKELEWDAADADAVHAVAYNRLGMPLATGRYLPYLAAGRSGVVKVGRMAVKRVMRGAGVGREVLFALMDAARKRGEHEVVLHAQRSAEAFYARLGYTVNGEPFEEAGIPHIEMHMRL